MTDGAAAECPELAVRVDGPACVCMVFGDGSALELATVTGSVAAGYTAQLEVAI